MQNLYCLWVSLHVHVNLVKNISGVMCYIIKLLFKTSRNTCYMFKKKSFKPDRPSSVNLCHHLLSPTDGSIISHFPQSEVLHNIAHSKGGAGAALVEGLACFRERETECVQLRL